MESAVKRRASATQSTPNKPKRLRKEKVEESEHDFSRLKEAVMSRSSHPDGDWAETCREWELVSIYREPGGHCSCNKPIVEHCVIRNQETKEELIVGNVCVERFGRKELKVDKKVFEGLHSLSENDLAAATPSVLKRGRELGFLTKRFVADYKKEASGEGCRVRYNPEHKNFDEEKATKRRQWNDQILFAFREVPKNECAKCGTLKSVVRMHGRTKEPFWACPKFSDHGR
eukprot:GILJ01004111.1.p1 GENE.GILJ01004111.1~~GILJ01004111.1.p1  ORF type:complete len:230 (-),score=24.49 GILJ01004111.1:51-740(-)